MQTVSLLAREQLCSHRGALDEVLRGNKLGEIYFGQMVEPVDGVQSGHGWSIGEDCFQRSQRGVAGAVETGGAVVDVGMAVIVNGAAGRIGVFGSGEDHAGRRMKPGVLGTDGMALHRDREGHDDHQGQH